MKHDEPTTESPSEMRRRVTPSSPVAIGVREDGAILSLMLRTITLDREAGLQVVQVLPHMKYKVIIVDDKKINNVSVIDRDASTPEAVAMKTLTAEEVTESLRRQLVTGGSIIRTSRLEVQ